MSDKFNLYEYIGVVAPGSVVIFGASLVFPEIKTYISNGSVSVGGLGIFLILSFVAGHLLQGLGNLFEKGFWRFFSGMPTSWVLKKPQTLLADLQLKKLIEKVRRLHPDFPGLDQVSGSEWFAITREIYAEIQSAGKSERADAFNRNYGLLRGLAVGFIFTTLGAVLLLWLPGWKLILGLAAFSGLAVYRMYRFAVHYAREVFVQFLRI